MLLSVDARPLTLTERRELRKQIKQSQAKWKKAHRASQTYSGQLSAIADYVGRIVDHFVQSGEAEFDAGTIRRIVEALETYASQLSPWATAQAELMLREVDRRDRTAWLSHAHEIGEEIRKEVEDSPVSEAFRIGLERQVNLITSLPLEAARRVHEIAVGTLFRGDRPISLIEEIRKTGEVTKSRAELIARTEVSRAATEFTKARANYLGSPGYVWRCVHDSRTRPSHLRLDGRFIRWDEPPLSDPPNVHAHAGAVFNCRCYPEVQFNP